MGGKRKSWQMFPQRWRVRLALLQISFPEAHSVAVDSCGSEASQEMAASSKELARLADPWQWLALCGDEKTFYPNGKGRVKDEARITSLGEWACIDCNQLSSLKGKQNQTTCGSGWF